MDPGVLTGTGTGTVRVTGTGTVTVTGTGTRTTGVTTIALLHFVQSS